MADKDELSEREREILNLVATGASNKEIANQLYISTNTVKVHLRNIFSKTGATSRTEAAMIAISTRLVDVDRIEHGESNEDNSNHALGGYVEPRSKYRVLLEQRSTRIVLAIIASLGILLLILYLGFFRQPNQISAGSPNLSTIPRWQERSPLPTARQGLAVAAYDEKIFAIGGETAQGVTGILEQYNPASDRWTELSPKPEPVTEIGAAVLGGKVYVPGGRLSSGGTTDVLEIYEPGTDKWTRGASLPRAISAYSLVAYEGNMYLFGGWDGVNYLRTVFEYNPTTDQWTEKSPMPTARAYTGATVAGGKIFVMGGLNGEQPLDLNEVYVPFKETGSELAWTSASPMPENRYGFSALTIADLILVVGGVSENDEIISNLEYNNVTDNWREVEPPIEQTWSFLSGAPLGTTSYMMGGSINATPTSKNIAYQALYNLNVPIVR